MSIFDIFAKLEQERKQQDSVAGPIEWLVVGLGNPGSKYENTRHNAGFRALDSYCQKTGQRIDRMKFKALVGEGTFGGKRVLFMKPQTFMNLSGEAVRDAADDLCRWQAGCGAGQCLPERRAGEEDRG